MASPTYSCRAIVLRKTRLKESDLIVTLLSDTGAQRRAVAKGARKPTSQFASRLELFCEVDLLCSEGRGLDIVKEARIVRARESVRCSLEHGMAAAPMAELLERTTQPSLEEPRLFQASSVAFAALEEASRSGAPAIAAAHLLKTLAFSGLRPALEGCVVCGGPAQEQARGMMRFSFHEGGLVCSRCVRQAETVPVSAATIGWARFFLSSPFATILQEKAPLGGTFSVLRLVQGLVREHVGARLRSLELLFSCGLFGDDVE